MDGVARHRDAGRRNHDTNTTDQSFVETARGLWQDERVEIVAAILLALATVLSAWGAYQATRWSGEQADAYARSAALRAAARRQGTVASRNIQVDVSTFLAWSQAKASGDERLATFLESRFRPEFEAPFEAWAQERRRRRSGHPRGHAVRPARVRPRGAGRGRRAQRPGGRSARRGPLRQPDQRQLRAHRRPLRLGPLLRRDGCQVPAAVDPLVDDRRGRDRLRPRPRDRVHAAAEHRVLGRVASAHASRATRRPRPGPPRAPPRPARCRPPRAAAGPARRPRR